MGTLKILSKSSNNSYSYVDGTDTKLTVNGNFEMDEQQKRVLSANGNIFYGGLSIASFNTSMYNDILQYQLYGLTADNTEKAFKALSGVQEQLKTLIEGTAESDASGSTEPASSAESEIAFLDNECIPCEYILNDAKSYQHLDVQRPPAVSALRPHCRQHREGIQGTERRAGAVEDPHRGNG